MNLANEKSPAICLLRKQILSRPGKLWLPPIWYGCRAYGEKELMAQLEIGILLQPKKVGNGKYFYS